CLPPAKAAKLAEPRMPAVAPVNRIVPRPRATILRATSRSFKKPEKHAISQILKYLRLAPGLFEDAARHIGAEVEHEHLDGTDLRLDLLDECDNFFFLAGIGTKAVGLAILVADLFEQRRNLLGIAARGAD